MLAAGELCLQLGILARLWDHGAAYSMHCVAGSLHCRSVGCIFGELLLQRPLFPGRDVVHMLELITDLLGTPSPEAISKVSSADLRVLDPHGCTVDAAAGPCAMSPLSPEVLSFRGTSLPFTMLAHQAPRW